jgi:hypothetical protein
MEMR